jgi:hypothetical protein
MPSVLGYPLLTEPAQPVRNVVEPQPTAPAEVDYQGAAEKMLRDCLEYPTLITERSREALRRAPFESHPEQFRLNTRLIFVFAKQSILQALALTDALIAAGIALPEAARLPEALRQIEAQEEALFRHWELPSQEAAAEALAAHARGETLEATDAFAEMAGVTREQWLDKVEAYKRSRGQ